MGTELTGGKKRIPWNKDRTYKATEAMLLASKEAGKLRCGQNNHNFKGGYTFYKDKNAAITRWLYELKKQWPGEMLFHINNA